MLAGAGCPPPRAERSGADDGPNALIIKRRREGRRLWSTRFTRCARTRPIFLPSVRSHRSARVLLHRRGSERPASRRGLLVSVGAAILMRPLQAGSTRPSRICRVDAVGSLAEKGPARACRPSCVGLSRPGDLDGTVCPKAGGVDRVCRGPSGAGGGGPGRARGGAGAGGCRPRCGVGIVERSRRLGPARVLAGRSGCVL